MKIKNIFYIILSVFVICSINAQEYKFRHLTTEDGLLHNTITSIIQDSKGFIWIGTYCGLFRYDGVKIKTFTSTRFDTTTISSNTINTIFEDKDNNIWIGCYKGGLNKYNIKNEKFERVKFNYNEEFNENYESIRSINQDKNGLIWIANEVGIFSYDPCKKVFVDSYNNFIDTTLYSNIFLPSDMVITSENKILFCYDKFLYQIDINNKEIEKLYTFKIPNINTIKLGTDGEYWISSLNKISLFTPGRGILKTYTIDNKNTGDNIREFWIDDSLLWIGNFETGLSIINKYSGKQIKLQYEKNEPFSLSNNQVRKIYKDSFGAFWIGTTGGVNLYTPNIEWFSNNLLDNKLKNIHGDIFVSCIAIDENNNEWYGTRQNGIIKYEVKNNKYVYYKKNVNNKNSILNDNITSLCFDDNGYLFIAVDFGLSILNTKSGKIWNYSEPSGEKEFPAHRLFDLIKDKNGNIWAGSYASGLLKMNFDGENLTWEQFLPDEKNETSIAAFHVTSLQIDKDNKLWAGTLGGGVSKIEFFNEMGKPVFSQIKTSRTDSNSIVSNDVLCLFVDNKNDLWIGTSNLGISVYHPKENSFSTYSIEDGLASNVIYSILEDNNNNMWIATNIGLSKINKLTGTISNFSKSDGFLVSQYYPHSACTSNDNNLLYGGKGGVVSFNPDNIIEEENNSKMFFTDLYINYKHVKIGEEIDGVVVLNKTIMDTDSITVSYNTSVLSIVFSAIQYISLTKNIFKYKLEGFDKDWHISDNNNQLTYTNLYPGVYTLKIVSINNNHSSNMVDKSLTIIVTRPYWQTWWFIFLSIIGIVILITAIFRLRTNRIQKYANKLEKEVNQRTEEIKSVNQNLKYINNELSEFAYIVSHDLKAPLRGIGQLATWIVQDSAKYLDVNGKENLDMLVKRVTRMNALIEGMLMYSRAGKITVNNIKIDLNESVYDVVEFLSLPKNVKIKIENSLPVIMGEKLKVEQAIQNIINNAVIFCDKEICEIEIKSEENGKYLSLVIEDNGPGIDPKYHKKIFEIFQTLGSKEDSIGLGLSIVKKVMDRHGGKVSIISPIKDGFGSAFILSFIKNVNE